MELKGQKKLLLLKKLVLILGWIILFPIMFTLTIVRSETLRKGLKIFIVFLIWLPIVFVSALYFTQKPREYYRVTKCVNNLEYSEALEKLDDYTSKYGMTNKTIILKSSILDRQNEYLLASEWLEQISNTEYGKDEEIREYCNHYMLVRSTEIDEQLEERMLYELEKIKKIEDTEKKNKMLQQLIEKYYTLIDVRKVYEYIDEIRVYEKKGKIDELLKGYAEKFKVLEEIHKGMASVISRPIYDKTGVDILELVVKGYQESLESYLDYTSLKYSKSSESCAKALDDYACSLYDLSIEVESYCSEVLADGELHYDVSFDIVGFSLGASNTKRLDFKEEYTSLLKEVRSNQKNNGHKYIM